MICLNKIIKILILIGAVFPNIISSTCVDEQLLVFLTKWRQGEELPFVMPQIKLITLSSYEAQYSGYGLSMSYTTGDMRLIGVNDFIVDALNTTTTDILRASGVIQFPLLTLTSESYSVTGRAFGIYPLKGSGIMRIAFDNVKVPFDISLGQQGDGMKIDYLRLYYTLDDVRVDLADSSWPINRILNTQGLTIVESYRSIIVELATPRLSNILDQYLAKVTPKQLLSTFIANCDDTNII